MKTYRQKIKKVQAAQWKGEPDFPGVSMSQVGTLKQFFVRSSTGQFSYIQPGDWVCRNDKGFYVIKRDVFEDNFELDPECEKDGAES